jgi:hypothetical protein
MVATCSSEMSVDFQRTTRRYIREDSTIRLQKPSSSYKGIGPKQGLYLQKTTQEQKKKKRGNTLSIPEMGSNL